MVESRMAGNTPRDRPRRKQHELISRLNSRTLRCNNNTKNGISDIRAIKRYALIITQRTVLVISELLNVE